MEDTVPVVTIEYNAINTLGAEILKVLQTYILSKFSAFSCVKEFKAEKETVHDLIVKLHADELEAAKRFAITNKVVGNTVLHRVVHLRFFAARAAELLRCTAKLAALSPTAENEKEFEQEYANLNITLTNLFETTKFLVAHSYNTKTSISLANEVLEIPGFGGGTGGSGFAEKISKVIDTKDKTVLYQLAEHVRTKHTQFQLKIKDKQLEDQARQLEQKGTVVTVLLGVAKTAKGKLSAAQQENARLAELTAQQHEKVFAAHPDATNNNSELCEAVLNNDALKVMALYAKKPTLCTAEGRSLLSLALLDKTGEGLKPFKMEELEDPNSQTAKTMTIAQFLLAQGANPTETIKNDLRSLLHMLLFSRTGNKGSFTLKTEPFMPLVRLFLSKPCDLTAGKTAQDFAGVVNDQSNQSEVATLLRAAEQKKGFQKK